MTEENKQVSSGQSNEHEQESSPTSIIQDEVLVEDELDEDYLSDEHLATLPTISKKIYWVIYALIAVILLGLLLGTYRLFPFFSKIDGVWVSEDYGTYEFEADGAQGNFTIQDVQDSNYIDMVFSGDLVRAGSNRYRMEQVNVSLEINKEGVEDTDVDALKSQEDFYTVVEEDEEYLKLDYTDAAIESAFQNNLETMFYFTLENFEYGLFGQDLRVRSETLSQNSFVMTKKEAE